jgi:hypothetical protein
MDIPRVSSSVRRITLLRKDAFGVVVPVPLYERSTSKKGTRSVKFFERSARRVAKGQLKIAESYLSRHEKSNQKKKDGWLRDFNANVFKASQKGLKQLRRIAEPSGWLEQLRP